MGSKARLAKDIAPIFNDLINKYDIDTYIEPFVGGANMIEHISCKTRIGGDNNQYLIAMWIALQNGWTPPKEMTRELYDKIKDSKHEYPRELVAIAGFCATYNAKWFGGYAGKVKTKIGTVRDYYDEAVRNILKQVDRLGDIEFKHCNYIEFSDAEKSLIYCDIPYQGTTKYGASTLFNYSDFWGWVRDMSRSNTVVVSEYSAPSDFECIYEKTLKTTLDKNSRKLDTEKLFILKSSISGVESLEMAI